MKLMIELTDETLVALREVLRIKAIDYRIDGNIDDYAKRIMQARNLLDFPVTQQAACYDVQFKDTRHEVTTV